MKMMMILIVKKVKEKKKFNQIINWENNYLKLLKKKMKQPLPIKTILKLNLNKEKSKY